MRATLAKKKTDFVERYNGFPSYMNTIEFSARTLSLYMEVQHDIQF